MVFFELKDFTSHVHSDFPREVAPGDGRGDVGDVPDLAGEIVGHGVDVVGQILPGAGYAFHRGLTPSLPSVPTSRATRVTSAAKAIQLIHHRIDGFFSSRISPFTSTVILRERSPRATAVVTSAMLRT